MLEREGFFGPNSIMAKPDALNRQRPFLSLDTTICLRTPPPKKKIKKKIITYKLHIPYKGNLGILIVYFFEGVGGGGGSYAIVVSRRQNSRLNEHAVDLGQSQPSRPFGLSGFGLRVYLEVQGLRFRA